MSTKQATFGEIEPDGKSDQEPTTEPTTEPTGLPAAGFPRRVESAEMLHEGMHVRLDKSKTGPIYRVSRKSAGGLRFTLERIDGKELRVTGGGPEFNPVNGRYSKELYLQSLGDWTAPAGRENHLLADKPQLTRADKKERSLRSEL